MIDDKNHRKINGYLKSILHKKDPIFDILSSSAKDTCNSNF